MGATDIPLKSIRLLVNTNLLISLAAVFLTLETQIQLNLPPHWHAYLFLIFVATLFEYNLHRLVTIRINKEAATSDKHRWAFQHVKTIYFLVFSSLVGLLVAITQTPFTVLLVLAPFAFLTVFYSLPVSTLHNPSFRLRQIPFLKIFLVSITWSATTILLPVIHHGMSPDAHVWMMLFERALFVFAITIPFDIRDMIVDEHDGLKTIPLFFGERKSLMISVWSLMGFILLTSLHYGSSDQRFLVVSFAISAISTIWFITNQRIRQLPLYHYGILDGTMLLQGVIVLGAYHLY